MIYPANFENKTGFLKLRNILKDKCLGQLGASKVDQMQISNNLFEIQTQLRRAKEFKEICILSKDFPQENYLDTRKGLKKITIGNTYLTEQELFDLKKSIDTLRNIIKFFKRAKEDELTALRELCADIFIEQPIIQCIQRVMNENGEIRDDASPELRKIRTEIRTKSATVSSVASRLLRTAKSQGWCDEDAEINIRDGKMLIPVQSSSKRKISGIVCDESASGKTAFIEPLESIELNNAIRELEFKERREIIKILIETSDKIRPHIPDLMACNEILAELDFARAKAKLAINMNADMPNTSDAPIADIRQARHPILEQALKAEGKKAVPLDVEINEEQRIIMISGPNAGGKSVCLKTVGIIQYMHQCGLLTPISPNSTLGIFNNIFIDIGDEQSIENDLSTYSSHLSNMKYFLDHSNNRTMILIDEFGTGTEPILGGAIAESILDTLNHRKVKGVITTHYTNLKNYATATDGLVNGAMMYDNTNMKPLFALEIGKIGNSFAFEMAHKIGISDKLLKKAEQIAGRDHIDYERRIQELEEEKRKLAITLSNAENHERNLIKQEEQYHNETEYTLKERKNLLQAYKAKFEQIIKDSNRQIERTILDIKNANAENTQTRQIRKQLEEFKQETARKLEEEDQKIDEIIERLKRKQKERAERRAQKRAEKEQKAAAILNIPKEKPICAGDSVYIDGSTTPSKVVEIKDGKALVIMGHMQSFVDIKRLTKAKPQNANKEESPKQKINISFQTEKKNGGFLFGLDVRGMRGDEAIERVAKYIDEALATGHREIKILHGTGTGALKTMIRNYLHVQPIVASYRDEKTDLGGAGITIVTLDY
jgi:DNA mismatch repair protein MutS2